MKKHLKNPPRLEGEAPTPEELRKIEASDRAENDVLAEGSPRINWLHKLCQHPILSPEETNRLARLAQKKPPDIAARNRLIRCNMRLVIKLAHRVRYQCRHLAFDDLVQEGVLGLARAVERYDPSRGFRLSTYATWWIRHVMTQIIADQNREIRLPVHVLEKLPRLRKLDDELGGHASDEELARRTGMRVTTVAGLQTARREYMVSLDAPVGENQDSTLGDFIALETAALPDCNLERLALFRLLAALPARERAIMLLRLGDVTLEEVGERFELTRERIRQIEEKTVELMRTSRHTELASRISVDDAARLIAKEVAKLFPGNEAGFWKRAEEMV